MAIAYFEQNPDVAAAYAQNNYGMTPDEFAATHYKLFGEAEKRVAPTSSVAPAKGWWTLDTAYNEYDQLLKANAATPENVADLYQELNPTFVKNINSLYNELLAQQSAGIAEPWTGADPRTAAMDMAFRLAESGVSSLKDIGQRTIQGSEDTTPVTELYNKNTGEALNSRARESEALGVDYLYNVTPSGTVIPTARKQVSTWNQFRDSFLKPALLTLGSIYGAPLLAGQIGAATGLTGAGLSAATGAAIGGTTGLLTGGDLESALKGALLGGAGGYLGGTLSESAAGSGFSGMNSSLTPAQIEAGLGTPGYGYGAQAASSGLFDPAMIGAGAYTQTSYPYDMADFYAADALQLQGQVGNNIPAIEQNLIAAGADPLVAADIANQVVLNPGISQYDLTNYINSTFNDGAGAGSSASSSGLTNSQITNLLKGVLNLAGAGAVGSNLGMGAATSLPSQGVRTNTPEYYQALQQYYNTYMPAVPRDVVTPLQEWYSGTYGTTPATSSMTQPMVPMTNTTNIPSLPAIPAALSAPSVPTAASALAPSQGLFTVGQGSTPSTAVAPVPVNSMGLPVAPQAGEAGSPEAIAAAQERMRQELEARRARRAASAGQPNTMTISQGSGVTGKYNI